MDTAGLPARVAGRVTRGRAAAEALHTLTLAAFSPTGGSTTGPNGYKVPAFNSEGLVAGKVQGGSQAGKDGPTRYVAIAGTERPVNVAGLHTSIGAKVPVAGEQRGTAWEYVVVAVGPADDPALLGRRYMVVGASAKSFATARRLDVVELDVPAVPPVTTIEFPFDTDGDTEGWLSLYEDSPTDAVDGRLLTTCSASGGSVYVEGPASEGTISAAFDLSADALLEAVFVQLDDRAANVANKWVPVTGIENPARVTLGPVVLTGSSYRLALSASRAGGEQIAVDNVVITITGG